MNEFLTNVRELMKKESIERVKRAVKKMYWNRYGDEILEVSPNFSDGFFIATTKNGLKIFGRFERNPMYKDESYRTVDGTVFVCFDSICVKVEKYTAADGAIETLAKLIG